MAEQDGQDSQPAPILIILFIHVYKFRVRVITLERATRRSEGVAKRRARSLALGTCLMLGMLARYFSCLCPVTPHSCPHLNLLVARLFIVL